MAGKPSITTPNALDLRAIAGAISNIRQRIEQIEAAAEVTVSTSSATNGTTNSTSAQISNLRTQVTDLAKRVAALELAGSTDIGIFTAGESIVAGQAVVPGFGSQVLGADASDPLRMFSVIGLAVTQASPGMPVDVQRRGSFNVIGTAFTPGRAVYVDGLGLTQTPSYQATALPVGVAISATQVFIAPDWPALQGPIFASDVGDLFVRYLPVTYSMVQDVVSMFGGLSTLPDGLIAWLGGQLETDLDLLPALPSGGLNGTELVVVVRDGVTVQTTVHEFGTYVLGLLTVSG